MEHNRPRRRQTKGKKSKPPSLLKRINHNAAGIDCGAETHFVAVPAERDAESVRSFKTFTTDLHRLADWLETCKVKTVAMESTGVYWIPIFEILEERGLEVVRVNSRQFPPRRGNRHAACVSATPREARSECSNKHPPHAKSVGRDEPPTT